MEGEATFFPHEPTEDTAMDAAAPRNGAEGFPRKTSRPMRGGHDSGRSGQGLLWRSLPVKPTPPFLYK